MEYYSYGRDQRSTRVVHPRRVFNQGGEWYLEAWCESVESDRTFRVDRVRSAVGTGETFRRRSRVRDGAGSPMVFHPQPDDPVWELDLDPPAHWIAEQYPNEAVEERPDGVLRVRLRAARTAWLERLLLRGGVHVRIVEGPPDAGRAAAGRVLARYRAEPRHPVL